MNSYNRDPQERQPLGWCERCGREMYKRTPEGFCIRCRERKERSMSLQVLAEEYRASAALLGERIDQLQAGLRQAAGAERERLNRRLACLCAMYRQTLHTAKELAHYYDPS